MTDVDAKEIVKSKFEKTITFMEDLNTHCGDNTISDKQHNSGNYYYVSNEFTSFEELKNELLNYMTEDFLNTLPKIYNKEKYYLKENN